MAEEAKVAKLLASHGWTTDLLFPEALAWPPAIRFDCFIINRFRTLPDFFVATFATRTALERLLVLFVEIGQFLLVGGALVVAPAHWTHPTRATVASHRCIWRCIHRLVGPAGFILRLGSLRCNSLFLDFCRFINVSIDHILGNFGVIKFKLGLRGVILCVFDQLIKFLKDAKSAAPRSKIIYAIRVCRCHLVLCDNAIADIKRILASDHF